LFRGPSPASSLHFKRQPQPSPGPAFFCICGASLLVAAPTFPTPQNLVFPVSNTPVPHRLGPSHCSLPQFLVSVRNSRQHGLSLRRPQSPSQQAGSLRLSSLVFEPSSVMCILARPTAFNVRFISGNLARLRTRRPPGAGPPPPTVPEGSFRHCLVLRCFFLAFFQGFLLFFFVRRLPPTFSMLVFCNDASRALCPPDCSTRNQTPPSPRPILFPSFICPWRPETTSCLLLVFPHFSKPLSHHALFFF